MTTYLLPGTTAGLVDRHVARCRNLGLVLDKCVPQEAIGDGAGKGEWLKRFAAAASGRIDVTLWEARYRRWLDVVQAIGAEPFAATLAWRMVVGLGGQSVLETDMTFDHVTGLPFIPGSALKGLARAYTEQEERPAEDAPAAEQEAFKQMTERIFGMQERAGTVIFFDALPVPPSGHPAGSLHLVVDVMNPHFPDYYRDEAQKPPSNDQNPVPIYFLTIEKATFRFAVGPRVPGMENDAKQATQWLQAAIKHYGVGAKTAAGYGSFQVESTATPIEREPGIPGITEDEVWNWLGRRRTVTGVVVEQSPKGAILKLDDPAVQSGQRIPRGLLVGVSRPVDGSVLTCRVMGVQQEQGEWFVKLSLQ